MLSLSASCCGAAEDGKEAMDEAIEFFHRLVQNDCPVNVVTLTILVKGLVQSGRANCAVREMDYSDAGDLQPNVVAFNTVVHGGLVEEALMLFEVMKNINVMPGHLIS